MRGERELFQVSRPMSEKHNRQSRWLDKLSSSHPGQKTQLPESSVVRTSRAERLQELRVLLDSGLAEKTTQPPASQENSSDEVASTAITVLPKPTENLPQPTAHSPQPKLSVKLMSKLAPLWLALMIVTPTGVGYLASTMLLKSPTLPNCPKIFWPIASASLRLYCAEMAANKETVNDLLVAIELVNGLSANHPLRPEINRRVERWSQDILELSEEVFQAGDLKRAVLNAQKVPKNSSAYEQVEQQIKQWKLLWSNAETIFRKAEDHLRQEQMNLAFREATRLLNVGNQYWETTKFQQLTDFVQITREESQKLAEAKSLAEEGGFENIAEALQKIEEIGSESYLYDRATKAVAEYSKTVLKLAEETLKSGDWQRAISRVQKIPTRANLEPEVEDFIVIARAHIPASLDTVAGLKDAITQAQKIGKDRPYYGKAQQLILGWKQEISAVATLEKARKLARSGAVQDLKAAVAQVRVIPASNPRGDDARVEMVRWTQKIEEIEDAPHLEMAEQLASFGDVDSLKDAIAQSKKISSGRALYEEAQVRISEWTDRSQRLQYQPILDQAQQLAAEGNLTQAISVAEQIKPGIVLYQEARTQVRGWKTQLRDFQSIEDAQNLAAPGTSDALGRAIKKASSVSSSSSQRGKADQLISQWSQDLLKIGLDQSVYDVPGAIATLRQIPYGSRAYNSAQSQIQTWEEWLNPPAQRYEPRGYEEDYNDYSEDYSNDYSEDYSEDYNNYSNTESSERYNEADDSVSPSYQETPTLQPTDPFSQTLNSSVELNKPISVPKSDTP